MNTSNDIQNDILNTINTSTETSVTPTTSSWFSYIQSINVTTWLIIILLLAFLGFNVFAYLATGTQEVSNIFGPIFKKLFGGTLEVTSNIVDTSAEGAKTIVNKTANIIDSGLTDIQKITPNKIMGTPVISDTQSKQQTNSLNEALNKSSSNNQNLVNNYEPNEANSSVNLSGTGKSGWCYIGVDRGFRSCAQVGVNDKCMSGEIFPSKEICINPNLRP
jgi:hypothetical protein